MQCKELRSPVVLAFVFVAGCAAMQQSFVEHTCNKDGAYQKGYNDAKSGELMNHYFADQCPAEAQDVVRQSYRQGYESAESHRPVQINIESGASAAPWMCKDSFGRQICGYNCLEFAGQVNCARMSNHACSEFYGKIYCGLNCRDEYGRIRCDESE